MHVMRERKRVNKTLRERERAKEQEKVRERYDDHKYATAELDISRRREIPNRRK
jgi:hypothetical protein